jgi:hypothetical protein
MVLVRLQFRDSFAWRLDDADPPLFALPTTADWFLLNPLFYPNLQPTGPVPTLFLQYGSGKYFGIIGEIVFVTKRELTEECRTGEFLALLTMAGDLFTRLRHLSGQATMPKVENWLSSSFAEIGDLPARNPSSEVLDYLFPKYWFMTAITAEHVVAAAALGSECVPPIQEVLLLDAIAAHRERNFRTAILYAAMSTEVALGSVIDAAYERIIGNPIDARFRVVGLPQAGGRLVYKDPVYERLRSRSDFSVLLHELPLYVLHRSLLMEDESLFQRAKRLYATRNKIVHSGELTEEDTIKLHLFDEAGSMDALKTAVHLFVWLGERTNFPLPSTEMISLSTKTLQATSD